MKCRLDFILLLTILCLSLVSCRKLDFDRQINIATGNFIVLEQKSFKIEGSIVDAAGKVIEDYGHVWSYNNSPEIGDYEGKSDLGKTVYAGDFVSSFQSRDYFTEYTEIIGRMIPGERINVRAYAICDGDLYYGDLVSGLIPLAPTLEIGIESTDKISFDFCDLTLNIVSTGNGFVSEFGVFWEKQVDDVWVRAGNIPFYIHGSYIGDTLKTGLYTGRSGKLQLDTEYRFFAYIHGEFQDYHSQPVTIKTLPDPNIGWMPGEEWTDIRDEKRYGTVQIGTQVWMTENLDIGSVVTVFQNQTNNNTIEKYYYQDNNSYGAVFGGLYQWDEAMNYPSEYHPDMGNRYQGICPTGWHIPSDEEFMVLESYLGMDASELYLTGGRGTIEGGMLKDDGLEFWSLPNYGATNSTGFMALPGGARASNGACLNQRSASNIWSSTMINPDYPIYRNLTSSTSMIYRGNEFTKMVGRSIRCIKD